MRGQAPEALPVSAPPVWIAAVSAQKAVCQELQFTDGVHPVYEPEHLQDWNAYVRDWLQTHELEGNLVILTEGSSRSNPQTNQPDGDH